MAKLKLRIDELLVERNLVESLQIGRSLIMARKVFVDGTVVDKAGTPIKLDSEITIKEGTPFVGRGGLKLASFLKGFNISVDGFVCIDVGSSTGGFTDCLLKGGAKRVHSVDVGKGLIDIKLREDPRVHLLEGHNIRHLEKDEVGEEVDIAVMDLSFISLKVVLPKVSEFLKSGGMVIALIKPQFEVAKGDVGRGGIVRDESLHRSVIEDISAFAEGCGYKLCGVLESPIKGAKGNKEFGLYLSYERRGD